jgi:glycosyltransferase involved in cell wall biosynthesis
MPHGMLDPYFQKAKDRKWKAFRNWIYWSLIEQKVVNECDGVLFTCEAELLLARGTFKSYCPKSEINVGYGIQSPPVFERKMQQIFEEKCPQMVGQKYLLFLSRIAKKKGLDILIKAYALLIKNKVSLPKLIIAGPGKDSSFGNQLSNLIIKNSLSDHVGFAGMLSGDAKWGAFYGCQAFILPSHQENFGIAVAEALACEKPVLISNQVNIWGKIEEGNAGIVAQPNEKGVYEMLKKWASISGSKKELMGKNARSTYKKHFEVESAANRFIEAIVSGSQTSHFKEHFAVSQK